MKKFAKLFDIDGDQVLVYKSATDDNNPSLEFRWQAAEGVAVTVEAGFDSDETRDEAFENFKSDRAKSMLERFNKSLDDAELEYA